MLLTNRIILLLLVLFLHLALSAQRNDTKPDDQLERYQEKSVSEKLFVHTDKSFYLAGEIIWFKLYYVDGIYHKPLDLSKVAYVEIVDNDDKAVLQSKIELNAGSGNGSLYLPYTLNSGVYRLRGYTHWMKNFNPDYFFEKPVTIVNSIKNLDTQPAQHVSYTIDFFPEGGNLVQNIKSKLAFKISDGSGKGLNGNGLVINQKNDTVAEFQPLKFGIGHFMFTPIPGDNYKAILNIDNALIERNLPVIQQEGYVMTVTPEDNSNLRVSVTTNISNETAVRLLVHTRQIIKVWEEKLLTNGNASFIIDKRTLGEGISHFTLFNSSKQPVAERLFFTKPTKNLNIEPVITMHEFQSREKVDIEFMIKDETGQQTSADISVAVYKVDGDDFAGNSDISSYIWLTSDIKGNIQSPSYYFLNKNPEADEAVDNLMLTHGWRRFQWRDVVNNTKPAIDYLPEYRGHIIYAKVTDLKTGKPASGIITYMSVPGKRVQFYASKSDTEGKVKFYTKDFYGPNEVLFQTDSRDTSYRVEIINPFSEKYSSRQLPAFELPAKMQDPLMDYSVSMQVQNVFSGQKLNQFYTPLVDSSAFYGIPDKSYILDDYVRFSTMEEVLREYVAEVLVRRQKENFRLVIAGGTENKIFMDDPITLFNGVPVFETNKIMQYDPLKIRKIEVIKKKYFYGPLVINGIVSFTTYQPDPSMISGLNAVVFDYEGLQYTREFYSPVYETPEQVSSRLPDFRNLLYWEPRIKTTAEGKTKIKFYTSDQKGKYLVVVQGMNEEGKFGQQYLNFTVK
jgi:hypothetical protein